MHGINHGNSFKTLQIFTECFKIQKKAQAFKADQQNRPTFKPLELDDTLAITVCTKQQSNLKGRHSTIAKAETTQTIKSI